jgi:hypothetical protein
MDVLKWEPYRIGVEDIVTNLRFLEDITDRIEEIKADFLEDMARDRLDDRHGTIKDDQYPALYGKCVSEIIERAYPEEFEDYVEFMGEEYPEGMPAEKATPLTQEFFSVRDEIASLLKRIAPEVAIIHDLALRMEKADNEWREEQRRR